MLLFIVFIQSHNGVRFKLRLIAVTDDVSMTSFAFVYSGLLIMVFSKKDKILIKNVAGIERLRCEKVY